MLKTLLASALLLVALFNSQVRADDGYILSLSYFEDPSNSVNFSEINSKVFTPYEGMLSRGYSNSTFWIKLQIRAADQELALRVRPAYAESIELFDLSNAKPGRLAGANYPWHSTEIQSYGHNFRLGLDSQERTLFLKMKTSRSYLLSLDVIPLREYTTLDHMEYLLYTGYIAFTFMLALGLFGAWVSTRERVLGIFTIQQCIATLHTFLVVGYARIFFDKHIDNQTINYIAYGILVTYLFVGTLANKLLLEDYGLKRYFRYLFNGLLVAPIGIILLMAYGDVVLALKINAQLVIMVMLSCAAASIFGINQKTPNSGITVPIFAFRAYYIFNLLGWLVAVLPLLGFIQGREVTLHALFLYNALSGLIFFWLLQYRARLILRNEIVKSDALKKQALEERLRREEQGKLMAMLTHEIRTPLSVLKLVVDRKVAGSDLEGFANRAVSNIDAIIDKCIQLDQLDFNALQIHKVNFNLSNLLKTSIADLDGGDRVRILGDSPIDLNSDMDIIRVIANNLIGNALKYSPKHSLIDVQPKYLTHNGVAGVELSVSNGLADIDDFDPAQVFDKYYRGPSSSRISGSGLGLFLVKELVYALHGEVKCSIDHDSVTFTIWIPA